MLPYGLGPRQLLEIILVGLAFVALLTIIEVLKRRDILHRESARKSVHISVGFILAALPLFMDRAQVVLTNLGFFGGVLLLSGIFHVFTAVHAVKRWTIGEFLYPLSTAAVALIYDDLRIYTFAVFTLGISDGLAGLIGRAFGGRGYQIWGGTKSLLGNSLFFISSWLILGAFVLTLQLEFSFELIGLITLAAGLLTLVEAAFARGFDNVAVPLAAAWVASVILSAGGSL